MLHASCFILICPCVGRWFSFVCFQSQAHNVPLSFLSYPCPCSCPCTPPPYHQAFIFILHILASFISRFSFFLHCSLPPPFLHRRWETNKQHIGGIIFPTTITPPPLCTSFHLDPRQCNGKKRTVVFLHPIRPQRAKPEHPAPILIPVLYPVSCRMYLLARQKQPLGSGKEETGWICTIKGLPLYPIYILVYLYQSTLVSYQVGSEGPLLSLGSSLGPILDFRSIILIFTLLSDSKTNGIKFNDRATRAGRVVCSRWTFYFWETITFHWRYAAVTTIAKPKGETQKKHIKEMTKAEERK